jgi:glycosyltransferase involved in cell wall biosynthesis
MENQIVSIVIPVFNSQRFLKQSIKSVLNQTYPDIEIIVIDDGSTDNSVHLLEDFTNDIIIFSKSNEGLASSLNFAVKKISGNWFKWISPDDILKEDAIEILVNETKRLPANSIIYSDWDIIDKNSQFKRTFHETNYNDLDPFSYNVRLLDSQQINVNTTLIPSLLFSKGCLFASLQDQVAIDYDFFLRAGIIYDTKFHLISKPLIQYRVHQKQLSHKNIVKTLRFLDRQKNDLLLSLDGDLQQEYRNALKKYQNSKPLKKKALIDGFKIISKLLPPSITDELLIFYLNKIRTSR